jgi:hypothetical protein
VRRVKWGEDDDDDDDHDDEAVSLQSNRENGKTHEDLRHDIQYICRGSTWGLHI